MVLQNILLVNLRANFPKKNINLENNANIQRWKASGRQKHSAY